MLNKIAESTKKFYALKERYPLEIMAKHVEPQLLLQMVDGVIQDERAMKDFF